MAARRGETWLERLEKFAIDVILGKRFGKRAAVLRFFLLASSRIFEGVVQARLFLYERRLFRNHTLGCLVISVGNLTVGGTGKTPVVEKFARALAKRGRRVAILSRGYKSEQRPFLERLLDRIMGEKTAFEPRVVSDGKALLLDSATAGDEPYMLATNLKDVVILTDKDRVKSGRYAIEKFGADTLLLDDGFQYLKLKSRPNIVLVDGTAPFGTEYLLPRGTLREPPRNIRRATHIFITKTPVAGSNGLREQLHQLNPNAKIIECRHRPLHFLNVFDADDTRPLEFIVGRKVAAISGIAMPDSFEESLRKLGAQLVYSKQYADHHRFSQQEVLNMINRSRSRFVETIITTEKDAVRFPKVDRIDLPIYYLRVEIEVVSGAKDFDELIDSVCSYSSNS
ncbi:MAG: tetraacyldisaccharide 4'-kinase [Verrucomicrobiae bacterium]|nr:tetraacyldisaccharide 4'-kinase [Verrucomicrobiae bacterium]